ncbi:PQQ-dependent sugar dehydrogenase [Thiothrix lacustris]|uniref:PQQ-dependent sugar dehydrogenase n=1 Tax=Thiothrix lacustris TaxID=525917 RepID=UPI00068456A0|nr:PQQ-dependent sugar dehydrogenase [Thiothrix lacustris]
MYHPEQRLFGCWLLAFTLVLLLMLPFPVAAEVSAVKTVDGLKQPWGMAFLPDGDILISERSGTLRRIHNGKLLDAPVSGLPAIEEHGQGGLLGLALHPQFAKNHWLYVAYAGKGKGGYSTHLARGQYQDGALTQWQVLFEATPKSDPGQHFGGRVVFDRSGYVYLSLGDRGERDSAQDLSSHAGSVIRLHDDGRIPADNPFVNTPGAKPEIYSYGHRNMQCMALHPVSGQVWTCEHGPQGGDEVNIERAGANYGWPVITYGEEYGGGAVGKGATQQEGMEQPVLFWKPSIAPSGMAFYTGDKYPAWRGNLFVGALKSELVSRVILDGNRYVNEERLLENTIGRIRDIQQAPDGYLYVLTDEDKGGLYRLELVEQGT